MKPIDNFKTDFIEITQNGKKINIIKINFDIHKNIDYNTDFYHINKYKIPNSEFNKTEFIDNNSNIMHYFNTWESMGNHIHMGGYKLTTEPKTLNITKNIQSNAKFILDDDIEENHIYVYELIYRYNEKMYSIVDLSSYGAAQFKKIKNIENTEEKQCLRKRVFSERGKNESKVYAKLLNEIQQDLKKIKEYINNMTTKINNGIINNNNTLKINSINENIKLNNGRSIYLNNENLGFGNNTFGQNGRYGL